MGGLLLAAADAAAATGFAVYRVFSPLFYCAAFALLFVIIDIISATASVVTATGYLLCLQRRWFYRRILVEWAQTALAHAGAVLPVSTNEAHDCDFAPSPNFVQGSFLQCTAVCERSFVQDKTYPTNQTQDLSSTLCRQLWLINLQPWTAEIGRAGLLAHRDLC
ncbi:hypothetical protein CSUB01_03407 [Colletotrichum sublineola]|uniref:Uncharacterized protein n=1 Tax=Colletotrichum sublineola TaxID=1173701 RepID=A0A066XLH2_COLSU|nr:hypothetical protein CSUB01_03407 [Colletotrichum sublineola]